MKKQIKIYSISTCNHCRCAKNLLIRHGVKFECEDLDLAHKDKVASLMEEVRRLNSRCSLSDHHHRRKGDCRLQRRIDRGGSGE